MKTKFACSLVVCTIALATGLGLAGPASAQDAPAFIPVQGSLTGDDGAPRAGMYTLEFRLYAQEAGGSAFYAESQEVMVDEGIFTAYLGDGTPADLGNGSTSPPLDLATFASRPRGVTFLGITIDEDPEMTPRVQLGSVPFAAFAQTCASAATLDGKPVSAFASSDASSLTTGTLPRARLPELTAGDLKGGKLTADQIPDLSNTYAPANHTHSFSELTGSPPSGESGSHTHRASEITSGTLAKARIPDLGDVYLQRGRFAWGRKEVPGATSSSSGSVADPNGSRDSESGPAKGFVAVSVPDIGCSRPHVWVSPNSNGDWNFVATNVRHAALVDGRVSFEVRWVNLYQEQGYTLSFDWLAFCP
ncbi:MAG: hypothetical protein OXU20_05180 [Myxococcales bacterium]|nr:hypothetical protein [Myxococcales bacterium]